MTRTKRGLHRGIAAGIVLVLFLAVCYAALSLLAPAPAVAGTALVGVEGTGDPGQPMRLPDGAQASGVAVMGLEPAVDAAGSDDALPMASIVKLATALVVLEEHPLEPDADGATVTMTAEDLGYYWDVAAVAGVVTDLREGEELTQRQLLERSLVVSSGNATMSLVRWAFGSEDAWLAAAAEWADRQGLDSMTIADATGLDAASVASAADMARLGRLAFEDPVISGILALERIQVMGQWLRNTNPMLGDDDVIGGKTGTLFASGRNLLVAAERDVHGTRMTLISVIVGVRGSTSVSSVTSSWLRQSFDRFSERVVLPRGTVVGEYAPPWSDRSVTVSTTEDLVAITWPGIEVPVAVLLDELPAGTLSGTPGNATAVSFDTASSVDVKLDGMVPPPDALWRLGNPGLAIGWVLDLVGRA